MIKIYRLNIVAERKISETEGKMTFHLIDENGDYRTVWGYTELDDAGRSIKITAHKKREHPLIQCLFKSEPNDKIKVEFTQYNEIVERDDVEISISDVDELMENMQKKPFRLGPMLKLVD